MTEQKKKAILELQDYYEYHWNKSHYDKCKTLINVFCILNKYLTGQTGWRIQFEGSKANDLFHPFD